MASMTPIVSLRSVVDEIDSLMEGSTAYLNRKTCELLTLQNEDTDLLEDDLDQNDLPDWQREELQKMREVFESEEWLELPGRFEVHEWAIMRDFARSVAAPDLRRELEDAIHGRGAFRYFKDTINRHGLWDSWQEFRTAAVERVAINWLDEHGIAYARDQEPASGDKAPN